MKRLDQQGVMNALLIPFILVVLFFLGSSGFGYWAYMQRADYKNNVDQKVTAAVEVAKQETASTKDNEFIEKEKQPLKPYVGPSQFGTVGVLIPKTWSAYVNESGKGGTPVTGFFHPSYVPGTDSGVGFALRIEVVETQYAQIMRQFDGGVKNGSVKVSPYSAPKESGIIGARVDGEIVPKKKGSMIVLPLRDKTLKVWTEAESFTKDLDSIILPNLTFTP